MPRLRIPHLVAILTSLGLAPFAVANEGGGPLPFELLQQQEKPRPKPRPAPAAKPQAKPAPQARPAAARPSPTPQQASRPRPRPAAPVERAPSGRPPLGEERFLADQVIVRYRLASSQAQRDALVRRLDLRHLEGRTFALAGITVHRYEIVSGQGVAQVVAALEADRSVVYAQPNYIYEAAQAGAVAVPQYAVDRLALHAAQEVTRGAGVRVAIVDSAVDAAHPEFLGATVEVHDVRDNRDAPRDGHGTSIAGIVGARGSLAGVAPDATILAIAAFAADSDGVVRSSSWAIAEALDLAHAQRAAVLNMSFAGPADPLIGRSLRGAARRSILAVAASGNAGPDAAPFYPAAYPDVLAVAATDASDAAYADGSGGAHVAFAAPGVDIVTVAPGGSFGVASGTSLATAHVSGMAALLLAADPSLKRERILSILEAAAKDLGAPGRDPVFGFGVPDAALALKSLATQ